MGTVGGNPDTSDCAPRFERLLFGRSQLARLHLHARQVTGKAMQLMGGYGYSREFPLEQKMRDAWGWGIAGGAIDIQKINITSALVGRRFNQRAR